MNPMQIDKKVMHRLFALVAGSIVFAWLVLDTSRATALFQAAWSTVAPFVFGAGIAFVFNVPMRALENQLKDIRKEGLRRILAILLTLFILFLIIMFVFELLVPQIRETVEALTARIPVFVERAAANIMVFVDNNPELEEYILETNNLEQLDWPTILQNLLKVVADSVSKLMGGAVNVIGNITGALVNAVISIVFALYCLTNKDVLAGQGRRLAYALLSEKNADRVIRIMRLTNVTFSNFISGQCLEACILGALFAVVMAILKLPYIPLVSVIIAVTALIPVVGAFVGCIVGAFFILVNDPLQAVTFVAMFLVLQQLENNLIYPRVVGTSIGLPGMWVLVAVTIGGEIMGVGGMFIMIPLVSVLYALAKEYTDKRLAEKGVPSEKLNPEPVQIKSHFEQNRERKERIRLVKMREKLKALHDQTKK
jgi:predicted PurR-regulated permease PerM